MRFVYSNLGDVNGTSQIYGMEKKCNTLRLQPQTIHNNKHNRVPAALSSRNVAKMGAMNAKSVGVDSEGQDGTAVPTMLEPARSWKTELPLQCDYNVRLCKVLALTFRRSLKCSIFKPTKLTVCASSWHWERPQGILLAPRMQGRRVCSLAR